MQKRGVTQGNDAAQRSDCFFGLRRYATAQGVQLYRSRDLDTIDQAGIQHLISLGITDIFDVRKQAERSSSCLLLGSPIKVHTLSFDLQGNHARTQRTKARNVAQAYGPPGSRMVQMYTAMAAYRAEIEALASIIVAAKSSSVVHCVNGKDRSGVVCACVMAALGYGEREIMQEYLYTNVVNHAMNSQDLKRLSKTLNSRELHIMRSLFEAREEYLTAFFQNADAQYFSKKGGYELPICTLM